MSGPIVPGDQVASTNRLRGNGFSSPASTASNTDIGAAPPNAPALPTPCDLLAPHHGLFLYVFAGTRIPGPARTNPGHKASGVPPAACPSASPPAPDPPESRNAPPTPHTSG